MSVLNPYRGSIRTLDDARAMSPMVDAAVDILRGGMKQDTIHDESHIVRVLRNALWFGTCDGNDGDTETIATAAILHDVINVPKDSPKRSRASRMSANYALERLYHKGFLKVESAQKQIIRNAIEAHSWTANIMTQSLEAECVQDADRLEALGSLGIARLFSAGGSMGRPLFHPTDPFARERQFDDLKYSLDHYYIKLQHIPATMKTNRGRSEAVKLYGQMERFIKELIDEL